MKLELNRTRYAQLIQRLKTPCAVPFLALLVTFVQPNLTHAQRVSQIAAGGTHNLVVREDGRLWAFGANWAGQLGDATKLDRSSIVPAQIDRVKQVAGGQDHTLAIAVDGRVFAWGRNDACQIGSNYPAYMSMATLVAGLPNSVIQVAAGYTHSIALDSAGSVWTWGGNSFGELGTAISTPNCAPNRVGGLPKIQRVWTSARSTFALAEDGTLWSWGDNNSLNLGWGSGAIATNPGKVQIGESVLAAAGSQTGAPLNGAAIGQNGNIWMWGANSDGNVRWDASAGTTFSGPTKIVNVPGAVSVHMTARSLFVRSNNGELRQFTRTASGMSQSRLVTNVTDVAVGSTHFIYLGTDGSLSAVGPNSNGQLGDAATTSIQVPRAIKIPEPVSKIAAGYGSGWAVARSGALYAWGDGTTAASKVAPSGYQDGCVSGGGQFLGVTANGQLNQISSAGVATALVTDPVAEVSCGHAHQVVSVAGTNPRTLAWGWNGSGQLGNGTTVDSALPTVVSTSQRFSSLSTGYYFSGGLDAAGQLFVWGGNTYGAFGNGTTTGSNVPTLSTASPSSGRFQKFSSGSWHSLALDTAGGIWAWGENSFAQLGLGSRASSTVPQRIGGGLPAVAGITAGRLHSAAVAASGDVYSWGSAPGSGADGDALTPVRSPWLLNIERLAARGDHTFALSNTGRVFGWGGNASGQLGISGSQDSTVPKQVLDPLLPTFTQGAYPVVEYANKAIEGGRYFITNQMEETKALDGLGVAGGFERTGRAWRAWPTLSDIPAGVSAKPVYRFYVPGPNSHFYTVSESERDLLINYNANLNPKVHQYEGVKFYALQPSGSGTGASCPANTYPVYRAFNNKVATNQGNHRITSNYIDIFRGLRFFGWTDEGIVFCSPVSSINGGDLHAYHTFPGDSVNAGSPMTAECLYNNAGPGNAPGATIHCALPHQVNWTLSCVAKNGATCPALGDPNTNAEGTLTQNNLREGINLASFPAGGILTITAKATAPSSSVELIYASAIATPGGAPDPVATNNITAGLSKTIVKSSNDCIVTLSSNSLSTSAADTQMHQVSLKAPTGCAWTISNVPTAPANAFVSISPTSGTGDATLSISTSANSATTGRAAQITATATTAASTTANKTALLLINQSAAPVTDTGCSTLTLNRTSERQGANIINGSVTVLASSTSCTWTSTVDQDWVSITQGASGTGTGTVNYQLQANPSSQERTAKISIKGSSASTPTTLSIIQSSEATNVVTSGGAEGGGGDGGGDGGAGGSGGGGEGPGG
jgi:alpha-tubulin suppressor-like RCC1 family protein